MATSKQVFPDYDLIKAAELDIYNALEAISATVSEVRVTEIVFPDVTEEGSNETDATVTFDVIGMKMVRNYKKDPPRPVSTEP